MKKKGFTLVELLAVIAILAILVIMALPAVLRMFNSARKDSFTNEVNTVIRTARQQYLLSGGQAQSWSNAEGSTNKLNLTGNSNLKYYVEMNGQGQIIKLQASNGDFQYSKTGIIDIVSSSDVVEVTESNQLVINANGVGEPTDASFFEYEIVGDEVIITNYKMFNNVTYDIDIATCKNFAMNELGVTEEEAIGYCSNDENAEYTIEESLSSGYINEEYYNSIGLTNVSVENAPTDVVIPSIIEGKPVTTLAAGSFASKGLTSVVIPNTVTTMENGGRDIAGVFDGNQITSVIISSNLTQIGAYALSNNQLTSITIPDSVTTIGSSAFYNNQLTSITIPDSVTTIGSSAFSNNQLTSINFGSGVNYIGKYAFSHNQLTSITIPGNVGTIDENAFANNQLTSLTVSNGVTGIKKYAFSNNQIASLTVPTSARIESYSFQDNPVTSIRITYTPGYESIYDQLFNSYQITTQIDKTVVIDEGITSIGDYAFSSNKITSVTLPSSLTSIESGAFQSNKLTSVTLPNNITSIYNYAFSSNQLTSITVPSSLTTLGNNAFGSTISTLTISYSPGNESIQSLLFSGGSKLPNNVSLIINEGITSIDSNAFSQAKLSSVSLPNSLITIRDNAFSKCDLTSITIPNGVVTIKTGAFYGNQLTSITIPSSVTSLELGSFNNNQFTSVTIKSKTSSSEFTNYKPNWGWASDVTCTTNNTSNVTNGCITWGA